MGWFLHRMIRISRASRVSYEEVLRKAVVERLLMIIRKKQLKFLGHILREDGLERNCISGRVKSKKMRGRQKIKIKVALLSQLRGAKRVVDSFYIKGGSSRVKSKK